VVSVVRWVVAVVGSVIATVGACPSVRVTVSVSVDVLFSASRAMTVITLAPLLRGTGGHAHADVPLAEPAPPRSLAHVTCTTPTSSVAVPPRATDVAAVEWVVAVVGVVMVATGARPSAMEKSIAPAQGPSPTTFVARTDHDAGPAASVIPGCGGTRCPRWRSGLCGQIRRTTDW
jgi:hypothetical protein